MMHELVKCLADGKGRRKLIEMFGGQMEATLHVERVHEGDGGHHGQCGDDGNISCTPCFPPAHAKVQLANLTSTDSVHIYHPYMCMSPFASPG